MAPPADDPLTATWPAGATRWLAFRLTPGQDLRQAVVARFDAAPERAGFVAACVGSLSTAAIRPAGRDDALTLERPLEIVALSGTLSPDGPHLHLALADETGAMTGGHLLDGCRVRTTAELVLGLIDGPAFLRRHDPRTGYAELFVQDERG